MITDEAKVLLRNRDKSMCAHCRKTIKLALLTIDHVVPRAAGGSDELANLQLLCDKCNRRKKANPDPVKIGQIVPEKAQIYVKWASAYGIINDRPLEEVLP